MIHQRPLSLRLFSWTTSLLFVLIVLLPVIAAFMPPLFAHAEDEKPWFHAFHGVLLNERQLTLLTTSLCIALGTTVAATLLGVALGFSLEYLRVPGRKLLCWAVAASFLIPPYVSAVAWIELLGKNGMLTVLLRDVIGAGFVDMYSRAGVIFVLTLSYYPIVVLVTAIGLRRFDSRLEEAALLAGTEFRALLYVTVPLVGPAVLSGSLFVFVLSLVSFSVPSLLTVNVYTVEIFSRFSAFHDFAEGTALALPLLVIGYSTVAAWRLWVRPRQAWLTGHHRSRRLWQDHRVTRLAAAAYCYLLVVVSFGLPVFVLLRKALPLSSFAVTLGAAKEEILTSIIVSACSATGLCLMGFSLAYLARKGWGRLYGASILPFLVSGPVLGIGLIRLWNHDGLLAAVYDSFLIVVLACVGRYLVFAHQGVAAALGELHPRLEEAAETFGISWLGQATGIVGPLVLPALIATWGLGFLFSFSELDAVILVYPPGLTTLPVRLFTLMHYGPNQMVAALSLISVLIVLSMAAVVFACCLWVRRRRYGAD